MKPVRTAPARSRAGVLALNGVLCAIAITAMCAGSASAETQQERGKRMIEQAVKALGGEKFQRVANRVETGRVYSFYHERLRGLAVATIYTKYMEPSEGVPKYPSQVERDSYGKKKEDYVVLFPGKGRAYTLTYRGAKPLPADRIRRYDESSIYSFLYIVRMRMHEPGMTFLSAGTDIIDNTPVELVDIIDADNHTVRVALHLSTHLPVRQTTDYRDPKTKERNEEVTYFSKFRDVGDGVMWPFHVERVRDGEKVFEMFADGVKIDQDLKDELFRLPGEMKVLPEDRT